MSGWKFPQVRLAVFFVAIGLMLGACGGSDDAAATTTSATEPSELSFETTTTTARPTTTETEPTTTETTVDPALIAPLTGLAVAPDVDLARPALVVKIDNHPTARPQSGLDQADIVFDLRAESITRFTAVFHSQVPSPVGPVRSSRTSDFDLLSGFDNPLYGSSGGNDYVMTALRSIETIEVTNQTRLEYFRNESRPAPHNLYVNAGDLFSLAPDDATAPSPWFQYRSADEPLPATATPSTGDVEVSFADGPRTGFSWDEGAEGWARTQNGEPHLTDDGTQLAPKNVVIMTTTYGVSAADAISPELNSTGTGELLVLTDGHQIAGTWTRSTASDKPVLVDTNGDAITLTPGQTWVLYPEAGQVSTS